MIRFHDARLGIKKMGDKWRLEKKRLGDWRLKN